MRRTPAFDMSLFICILILVGLGIAFIYTASFPRALMASKDGADTSMFAIKQAIFAGIGLVAMLICMYFPLTRLHQWSKYILGGAIALLLLVLAIGATKHGDRSWIQVGSMQFQPSELAKVALIIGFASALAMKPWLVKRWRTWMSVPGMLLLTPVALIAVQGDLGTLLVVLTSLFILLTLAGMKARYILTVFIISVGGAFILSVIGSRTLHALNVPHANRFVAWLDPMDSSIKESYQPRMSLIAIGSGGFWGRGFCESRQKYGYLPAPHNDYILAVLAEELGFLKLVGFLFLPYLFLLYRGFTIAHRAPDEFSSLVAAGCTVMLMTQAVINMAVVTNIIPCMGVTLPFISYGGTSVIASMMMAGLLINVSGLRPLRTRGPVEARAVTAG